MSDKEFPTGTCNHCGWGDAADLMFGDECPPCAIARVALMTGQLAAEFHGGCSVTVGYGAYSGNNYSDAKRRELWGI